MKNYFCAVLITATMGAMTPVMAQKIDFKSGSLDVLSDQKLVNVEYDYSNFGVGKFASEKDYVKKKVDEYNAKEAGKGDAWKIAWEGDRARVFEPKFEEFFNREASNMDLTMVTGKSDAKYTFIVRTKFLEPGFNVGVVDKKAYIDLDIDLVETANKGNKVAQLSMSKVALSMWRGTDYDAGSRIGDAYGKAGKTLANLIKKKK